MKPVNHGATIDDAIPNVLKIVSAFATLACGTESDTNVINTGSIASLPRNPYNTNAT